MEHKKRILILTADVGFGHRSAANAIREALIDRYADRVCVEIANPLNEPSAPAVLHNAQFDYDRWARNDSWLYRLGYALSDKPVAIRILEWYFSLILQKSLKGILDRYDPQVIVSTHPDYLAPLSNLLKTQKRTLPLYSVVTDLSSVHRLWFHRKITGCLVPNPQVAELAVRSGLPREKITITGIPVATAISKEKRMKNELRDLLGWRTELPTILLVGSKRVDGLVDALHVINNSIRICRWR